MSRYISLIFFPCVLFLLLVVVRQGDAIFCYVCNSKYDPRCGDHFDNLTYPLTDCRTKKMPHLNLEGATKCRKMIMTVQGETRVSRECAFLGQIGYNDGRWCLERMGTGNVKYSVCLCDNKDGCNSASLFFSVHISVFVIFFHVFSRFL